MADEQLEAGIEAIQRMLEARAGDSAKVIGGTVETVVLQEPDVAPAGPNMAMDAADVAVGTRKRKPRKSRVPSAGT
jgi:hypothetical protein